MTTQDIIDYYSALLIIQYARKPKASAHIAALASEVLADQLNAQVRDAFSLDTAVGAQLDTIGLYLGVDRFVYGLNLSKNFFAMPSTADANRETAKGFGSANATDASLTWYFMKSEDTSAVAYRMNDEEYRKVLKFAAQVNASDLSVEDIDQIFYSFFGTYVQITDNENMTVTYTNSPTNPLSNVFTLIQQSGILPNPSGVAVLVTNA